VRFLISYSGNPYRRTPKCCLREIGNLEELLALLDSETARQPDEVRGLILMRLDKTDEVDGNLSFNAERIGLPREQWPDFELEVYDGYRE